MKTPLISVIIPAVRRGNDIASVVDRLAGQSVGGEHFECLVIGHDDMEIPNDDRYPFGLTAVKGPGNIGVAYARDTGSRQARGEILAYLDCDMLVSDTWLEDYANAFESGGADVVSGGRYRVDATYVEEGAGDPATKALRRNAVLGLFGGDLGPSFEQQLRDVCRSHPDSLLCAYSLLGSNVAIRRRAFERTSGFNPLLRRFGDIELGVRLWETGAMFTMIDGADAYRAVQSEPTPHPSLKGRESEPHPNPLLGKEREHRTHPGSFLTSPPEAGVPDEALFASGELWYSAEEAVQAFIRHPYALVLAMSLWGMYRSGRCPSPLPALDVSLTELAENASELWHLDLRGEFQRVYGLPVPIDFTHSIAGLADRHIRDSEQFGFEHLDLSLARGVYTEDVDGDRHFTPHYNTWVNDCTPILAQYFYFHHGRGHNQRTAFQRTGDPSELLTVKANVRYQIMVPEECVGLAAAFNFNLPLPAEHQSQTNLHIRDCYPDGLLSAAASRTADVLTVPGDVFDNSRRMLSYSFSCDVHEFAPAIATRVRPTRAELAPHLRYSLPADKLEQAREIVRQIVPKDESNPVEVARAIYTWIQDSIVWSAGHRSYLYPYYALLDLGHGSCSNQMRLFVTLCRLKGIPAREQNGFYCDKLTLEDLPFHMVMEYPTYHTWTEFYTEQYGWLPVEIYGRGRRSLNCSNTSTDERTAIDKDIRRSQEELFGSLDPFRVFLSSRVTSIPFISPKKFTSNWSEQLTTVQLQVKPEVVLDISLLAT